MRPLILVIDDEAAIRDVLRLLLTDEGYRVACAVDGQDALDSLVREVPALMLSDIKMPRVHGIAMVERLRTSGLATPVVLISTWVPPAMAGVRFVAKPFDLDEIADAVREGVAGGG